VLRRQAKIIALCAILGLVLGIVYSVTQTPRYTAHAEVLVVAPTDPGPSVRLDQVISMDTEARLVTSLPIAERAQRKMNTPTAPSDLLDHVTVKTSPDTFILDINYSDTDPAIAESGSNAFADAYIDSRLETAQKKVDDQRAAIQEQLAGLESPEDDALIGALTLQLASIPTVVNAGDVILPATTPLSPSSPKYPVNAAVGLFFGLFAGVLLAFVRDRSDDRIHERRDLAMYLPAPVMASIPHIKRRPHVPATTLVTEWDPNGPAAEAYRTARTGVLAMVGTRDVKVIAIASPMEQEGKTTTSANLATSLGHADTRVVVVSADVRKPQVHTYFGVANELGLTDVLNGGEDLSYVVARSSIPNVWVLPGGRPPSRPAELLQSAAMKTALDALREEFDIVILDCPPILGLSDTLALSPLADAMIMVVQAESSRGSAIVEASEQLQRVGVHIDGVILNNVREDRHSYHTYGYYGGSSYY
jgi:capsular exopolysaccharide synthesis family protein